MDLTMVGDLYRTFPVGRIELFCLEKDIQTLGLRFPGGFGSGGKS